MSLLKKIMSLGIAGMILLGYPSNISFAMTGDDIQEAQGKSGYRLYADELTSTAGVIKGDVSGVLPDNEIINVRLPDGSVVLPEEVNYPITESGDYTFEIYYEASVDNSQQEEHVESQAETQSGETENKEEPSNMGENVQADEKEKSEEIAVKNEEESEFVTETKKALSESLAISVVLPIEQISEEIIEDDPQVIDDTPSQKTAYKSNSVLMQTNQTNISPLSWGGYDEYNSNKIWSTSDFSTKWMTASNEHMNYDKDPPQGSIEKGGIVSVNDGNLGAKFTFGNHFGGDKSKAYWLQQGAAFSDITFDFRYDFALKGSLRIGESFGAAEGSLDSIDNTKIGIDGGVTVSFIPKDRVEDAKKNSEYAKGVAYRLGAYGTMPNSIICEFDTSTDTYYSPGDARNFEIRGPELQKTGDYLYTNRSHNQEGNAFPTINSGNIYELAKDKKYGGLQYENITHIGISATGGDGYVQNPKSTNEASHRVALGSSNTGTIPYEITYSAKEEVITFKITEKEGSVRTTSMDLTEFFKKTGQTKEMKLAFSYGAAYVDLDRYVNIGNFTNKSNTIDIWAKQLYVSPDLKRTDTKVRWLDSGIAIAEDNSTYNAYINSNGAYDYTDKKLWPVAGDRIYAQIGFVPTSNIMPQPGGTNPGKLKLRIDDLSIVDNKGSPINGLNKSNCKFYYKDETNSWKLYSDSDPINITSIGKEYIIRVELKLPELPTNSTAEEYYVTGNLYADYSVGDSKVTYKLALMSAKNPASSGQIISKINVSRDPMFIDFNGQKYYTNPRVIPSSSKIDTLKNITNGGNQSSLGEESSLHYGSGYRLMSIGDYFPMYQDRSGTGNGKYDIKNLNIQSASMVNISNIEKKDNVSYNDEFTIDFDGNRRYILEYLIEDSNYTNKKQSITQNPDRGISSSKRIIWTSDNVKVENGYEFYMEPEVTLNVEDFKDFDSANDKGEYYRKIAKAADVSVFKTANADWNNLARGADGNVSATISGTGNKEHHDKISASIKSPGTKNTITIQFKDQDTRTIVTKDVTIVFAQDTPKVVSNTNEWDDNSAEKVIFNKENYTVSATFKLENSDGSEIDLSKFKWDDVKDKINVALYKKNGPDASDSKDKFSRWANKTSVDNDGLSNQNNPKVEVPQTLKYNNDATFTVTFTLLNNSNAEPNVSWIEKQWENGAQWRIFAWTDSNNPSKDYSKLTDTDTDKVETTYTDVNVPSVVTTVNLIEKTVDGDLPTAMFKVPASVKLYENGDFVENFGEELTISISDEYKAGDSNVQHDSRYSVTAHTNGSSSGTGKPLVKMSNSKGSFKAYYYKQSGKTFEEINDSSNPLGVIGFDSNGDTSSLRFGIKGQKPSTTDKNDVYKGTATFKFTRQKIY